MLPEMSRLGRPAAGLAFSNNLIAEFADAPATLEGAFLFVLCSIGIRPAKSTSC